MLKPNKIFPLLILLLISSDSQIIRRNNIFKSLSSGGGSGTVTFDAVSNAAGDVLNGNGILTTLTYSHTVGAGLTDSYIVVGVGLGFSTAFTVTATYNSVSMDLIDSQVVGATGHGKYYLFGVKNPTAGAHNVVITCSAAPAVNEVVVSGSTSWSHVDQTTPFSNVAKANGDSTTASVTVTSAANNAVVAGANGGSNFSAWQATDRWHQNSSTATGGGCSAFSSAVGSASVGMTWTLGSDSWAAIGCNLNHD